MSKDNMDQDHKLTIQEFGQRLYRKIHSVGYRRELFCYLLIEELSLLLNVPALFVKSVGLARTRYDGPSRWITTVRSEIDADTNVAPKELERLSHEFDDIEPVTLAPGVELRKLESSEGVFTDIRNANLWNLDHQITLKINLLVDQDELDLEVRIWWRFTPETPDAPETPDWKKAKDDRRRVLSSLLRGDVSWHYLLGELEMVRKIEAQSHFADQRDHKDEFDISSMAEEGGASWFSNRKREFVEQFESYDPQQIKTEYNNRFLPLVKVANRIRLACNHLIGRGMDERITDYILTYRTAGEDRLSFLLSNKQAERFLSDDAKDFMKIMEWWYRDVGPSGYVLETGHSEFCPDPKSDPRWTEQTAIKGIKGLIRKLQLPDDLVEDRENDNEDSLLLRNTFLMPLCVQRKIAKRSLLGSDVPGNDIRMVVECRLPDAVSGQNEVRRQLFDLAWEFMPAIEASITAQLNTEKMISSSELRRQDLARWASLVHDLPKYVVQPTEVAVKNAAREFGFLRQEHDEIAGERARKINDELNRAIAKTQHAHYLLLLASPEQARGRKPIDLKLMSSGRLIREIREETSRYAASMLDFRYGDDTYNPIDADEEDAIDRSYRNHIGVALDAAKDIPDLKVPFYLIMTMIYNHVDNSLEELIKNCNKLILEDPERGEINIQVSFDADSQCLVFTIADLGTGMSAEEIQTKQEIVNSIISEGRFPEFESLRSEKENNMGAGIFNNAMMLSHLNRDSGLSSQGTLTLSQRDDGLDGLVIHLRIPVSLPPEISVPREMLSRVRSNQPRPARR